LIIEILFYLFIIFNKILFSNFGRLTRITSIVSGHIGLPKTSASPLVSTERA
jgi:hypothetical protein